jgi:hypothetical protein
MKVVKLDTSPSLDQAAEVLRQLENDLLDGKVVGFFVAAVGPDDMTYAYISSTKPVSRLRLGGAMQHALHMFNHGEEI